MFGPFRKLLQVEIDGRPAVCVRRRDLPCEKTFTVKVDPGTEVAFIEPRVTRRHRSADNAGWLHLSVRVHENMACQADCVISASKQFNPTDLTAGKAVGVRFQPFFLTGAKEANSSSAGRGLFARGLHFPGTVTPANVLLSCECDACHQTFLARSFHAGFAHCGYFYSESGAYTLTVGQEVSGAPVPLSEPEPEALVALEARLPKAPDGSRYRYLNPFRCPHCTAPYVDFQSHPDQRSGEYYGLRFPESPLQKLEDGQI